MIFGLLAAFSVQTDLAEFRVLPYLLQPTDTRIQVVWFSEADAPGELTVTIDGRKKTFRTTPTLVPVLDYHSIEENEKAQFPDMFAGSNWKYSVLIEDLPPDSTVDYEVRLGSSRYRSSFETAPSAGLPLKIIAFADSETDPEGRTLHREWAIGAQAPGSTGRPENRAEYLVTETQGFIENLKLIEDRKPHLLMLAGDIVQGGGYQRAWDEFFFHMAGKFGQPLSSIPLVPALGNWENFGARVGGYEPWAIHLARQKYLAYFDAPENNNRNYRGSYYRLDYGPVTILTLDSSNGLPDNTDNDTNRNIVSADYPGSDLPDIAPESDQWNWTLEQLKDARSKGQIIFVQFHHIPYSSGGHSLPLTVPGSSGQAGWPMRAYTPWFQEYGVTAVICGHNESFERSLVGDVLFYDVGVAGDGLGYAIDKTDPRRINPWRKWVAHHDSPELWDGQRLVSGGKHYGHLEIDVLPVEGGHRIVFTPVHVFPVTNSSGEVTGFERREYDDRVELEVPIRVR